MRFTSWFNSRVLRFSLAGAAVTAGLIACGGGGFTNPTTLQTNPSTPWTLLMAGDIAQCNLLQPSRSNANQTAELIERQIAAAGSNSNVLTLGDNIYFLGLTIGYKACFDPTWGRFADKLFALPGNHDVEKGGEKNYFDFFGPKASPPGAGPDRSGYYRLDQSGWTVFTLNSNTDAVTAAAQNVWLKKELATAKPCVAAAWHHARFSSAARGDNALMQEAWEILDVAKADLVVQAHEHHYERFAPMTSTGAVVSGAGIQSFVVGTGGADVYGFAGVRANSEKRIEVYGVMNMTLEPGKAAWRFIDVNNTVLDSGAFDCKKKS